MSNIGYFKVRFYKDLLIINEEQVINKDLVKSFNKRNIIMGGSCDAKGNCDKRINEFYLFIYFKEKIKTNYEAYTDCLSIYYKDDCSGRDNDFNGLIENLKEQNNA